MTEKWRQIQGKYNGTELEFVGELKSYRHSTVMFLITVMIEIITSYKPLTH